MSHGIDLLQWLGGGVSAACGYMARQTHSHIEAEDTGVAIMHVHTAGAARSSSRSSVSHLETGRRKRGGRAAHATHRHGERGEWYGGSAGYRADGHRGQLAEITDALLEGRAPAVDGCEGRKAAAIVQAIYESARAGGELAIVADGW